MNGRLAFVILALCAGRSLAWAVTIESDDSLGPVVGKTMAAFVFSSDLRRFAVKTRAEKVIQVQTGDGATAPVFDDVVARSIRFAVNGTRLVYVGRRAQDYFVVIDQKLHELPGPPDPAAFSANPSVSPDGSQVLVAYSTESKRFVRRYVAVSGAFQDWGPFDRVDQPQFAADGRAFFIGSSGKRSSVYIDGLAVWSYDVVGLATLSPNGKHAAYQASVGNARSYYLDGVPLTALGPFTSPFAFSPDSEHHGYSTAAEKQGVLYVVDGKVRQVDTDSATLTEITFAQDNRHGYMVVQPKGRVAYDIDGVTGESFGRVSDLTFTSSGAPRRFAYVAMQAAHKAVVVTESETSTPFALPSQPLALSWSPDGSKYAHVAATGSPKAGNTVVRVGNEVVTPHGHTAQSSPVFALTGSRLAHVARSAQSDRLVVDHSAVLDVPGVLPATLVATPIGFAIAQIRGGIVRRVEVRP